MSEVGARAVDVFVPLLDLPLPMSELVVQVVENAANLDLGGAERFPRLRPEASQRGLQRLERLDGTDSCRLAHMRMSALLQVFFDPLRLAKQIRDLLLRRFHETTEDLNGLGELLREALLLLIAPGIAESRELSLEDGELVLQFVVEVFQVLSKATQLRRINNGLGHAHPRVEWVDSPFQSTRGRKGCKSPAAAQQHAPEGDAPGLATFSF